MSRYRIRNVSQLCGVSTATLRAWERRYGVPSPARTISSYRLYSDADVALIKAMRDLVSEGMAAAEAACTVLAASERSAPEGAHDADPFTAAADRLVEAAARFDPDGLDLAISRALLLGSAVTVFERTLGPALWRIGDLWHRGTITVAQEHLASQLILGTLMDLVRLTQPTEGSRRVALACFADEEHCLGLYGIALRFASWGFRTIILGARTPPAAVARAVESMAPDVVGFSATMTPPRARELVKAYANACRATPWVVGGQASEGMRAWIEARGGLVSGSEPGDLRRSLERALAKKRRNTIS